ncbi:MAG: hypothetical protein QXN71_01525 [Candidatus Aenigmatarchaeota archaeon]
MKLYVKFIDWRRRKSGDPAANLRKYLLEAESARDRIDGTHERNIEYMDAWQRYCKYAKHVGWENIPKYLDLTE